RMTSTLPINSRSLPIAHLDPHSSPTRRSSDLDADHHQPNRRDHLRGRTQGRRDPGGGAHGRSSYVFLCWLCLPEALGHVQVAVLDRKSTRLNSSHVSISYAVFCLNTKNTKTVT